MWPPDLGDLFSFKRENDSSSFEGKQVTQVRGFQKPHFSRGNPPSEGDLFSLIPLPPIFKLKRNLRSKLASKMPLLRRPAAAAKLLARPAAAPAEPGAAPAQPAAAPAQVVIEPNRATGPRESSSSTRAGAKRRQYCWWITFSYPYPETVQRLQCKKCVLWYGTLWQTPLLTKR